MKTIFTIALLIAASLAQAAEVAKGVEVPACTKEQLVGYSPPGEEISAHRQFELPTISYPADVKQDRHWGVEIKARINESGQVVCHDLAGENGEAQPMNDERRDAIKGLNAWRYTPFTRKGQAVSAIVSERIREQELAKIHLPLPDVPLENIRISLERSRCNGTCPSYKVDVYGSGRVVYQGIKYVDVTGVHTYRIPSEEVAQLVTSLRAKDIWSLRPSYRASITDQPTYTLTIDMDGTIHKLDDYRGSLVGMPSSVSDFEDEVDKVARLKQWIRLSREAVELLEAEGFNFRSRAGAELLARAVADVDTHDEEAMLDLINLGTPIEMTGGSDSDFFDMQGPLIELALKRHRASLIDPLIAKGALKTGGRPDQQKIDAAFRAAITAGRLEPVQKIWKLAGSKPHPSLTFDSISQDKKHTHKITPVSLLVKYPFSHDDHWEGLAIAKWLVAQGCEIKAADAEGDTLLHRAAEAGDVDFVRYLLSHGMNASTLGEFGRSALGSVYDEDVAMILLEAGTRMSRKTDERGEFRRRAEENGWRRVIAWLNAHDR